jgi:starch phosphorylase
MALMNYGKSIGQSLRKMMETDPSFRTVAYFSMEIGLRPDLPTYSGGLGILAGDILKGAADLGVPMAGITLLYRKGYFRQTIDSEGWQHESPEEWKPEHGLFLLPNEVLVDVGKRTVKVRAWMTELVGTSGFPVPVYFLDTDFEENLERIRRAALTRDDHAIRQAIHALVPTFRMTEAHESEAKTPLAV